MIQIDLTDKVALITGAGGGIGRALACTLAEAGADVICNYSRNEAAAAATAQRVAQATGRAPWTIQASVADRPQVDQMATDVKERKGRVDILVLNAVAQDPELPFADQAAEHFASQIDTCMWHWINCVQAFLQLMPDGGRIIGISTECILQNWPNQAAYVGAKMGAHGYARVLARELGPRRITVNEVAPGWVQTYRDREAQPPDDSWYRGKGLPFPERGTDADVAASVAFLASSRANFITGNLLLVNGGMVLGM